MLVSPLPQSVTSDWIVFFQQVGLATVIVFAMGVFLVRYVWPYTTRKIDDLTHTVDASLKFVSDSQTLFISTLSAQRESHMLASEKQNEVFERVLQAAREDAVKLMHDTLAQSFERMDQHDLTFASKIDAQSKLIADLTTAIAELSKQFKSYGEWDGRERRKST